ncbi:MAG: GNAT family N-acetyltransferase, partial [Pseudomonas sp.]|nr:GNAT family N-acetyltransferase [Pseudomonas sp.]
MSFDIVNAGEADLPGILAIYNDAVQHTTAIW